MKTIFITIFQGVEAKNILRTKVFAELMKHPDIRPVLFVRSPERAEYYRRQFSDPRIRYEAVDYRAGGRLERFFGRLKFHLLRTKTTDLRRRMDLDSSGDKFAYFSGLVLNRIMARSFLRRVLRWLDRYLVRERPLAACFDKYQPDLLFLAHLFDDVEIALLREAKRRNIPTIGFVNSWDKLTARCIIRLLPDQLLVYNDIVKREAMVHADMKAQDIEVVGIPQYDLYVGYTPTHRQEFLRRIGLAPQRRFILYAPMGETFSDSDWDIIDLLHRWLGNGSLPPDVDLLVRFQPNDLVNEKELAKRSWLHFDRPGTRFSSRRGVDWDMSEEELRHLADTLAHTSLLVCYASSLSVDAAIFAKPVINIGFEIKPAERLVKSPTQFYKMEHYRKALDSGGIQLVRSDDDLLHWMNRYLQDPAYDQGGRARLVSEQCGKLDGKAGERIASAILEAVRGHNKHGQRILEE